MNFTSVEPEAVEKMSKKNPDWTICEELRIIWELLKEITEESFVGNVVNLTNKAMYHVRIATAMAKKMDGKLREYDSHSNSN